MPSFQARDADRVLSQTLSLAHHPGRFLLILDDGQSNARLLPIDSFGDCAAGT